MAIALLSHVAGQSGDSNGFTTDGSGGHGSAINTTGATLLIFGISCLTGTTPTVSDNKSNTWTGLTVRDSGSTAKEMMFYSSPSSVGTGHTFTITGASTFPTIFISAWSGVIATSPLDQQNGATAVAVTTIQTGSVTPGSANQILITTLATTENPVSIDSGFTILDSKNTVGGAALGGAVAYLIETTATAQNPAWTINTASFGNGTTIGTFKPTPPNNRMFLVF